MRLQKRWFRFQLQQPLHTSRGAWHVRQGWLLRIEAADGAVGWGEVAPLHPAQLPQCTALLDASSAETSRQQLDQLIQQGPGPLGFGLGAALAELDGLLGSQGWLKPPPSAVLLPAGEQMVSTLERLQASDHGLDGLTLKWKVATEPDVLERQLLETLLQRLPPTARLRLDANGGWDRSTALAWMRALAGESRLAWLEQPLPVEDQEGLEHLATLGPVALDESLDQRPQLRRSWRGWQVRRPALDGDPRVLLRQLQAGVPQRMVSTAFETGIGRRWLEHLAALQWQGPTPAAPGLAPGWCPPGPLFGSDPEQVWAAAR